MNSFSVTHLLSKAVLHLYNSQMAFQSGLLFLLLILHNNEFFYMSYLSVWTCVHVCVPVYAHACGCLRRPGEGVGPLELEFQVVVIWPTCVLGNEFRPARAAYSLHTEPSL